MKCMIMHLIFTQHYSLNGIGFGYASLSDSYYVTVICNIFNLLTLNNWMDSIRLFNISQIKRLKGK